MFSKAIILLAAAIPSAFAQSNDNIRSCNDLARAVVTGFKRLQSVDEAYPGKRDDTIIFARRAAYDKFTKKVQESPENADVWSIERGYFDIAINHFEATPTAIPNDVERRVYEICISNYIKRK